MASLEHEWLLAIDADDVLVNGRNLVECAREAEPLELPTAVQAAERVGDVETEARCAAERDNYAACVATHVESLREVAIGRTLDACAVSFGRQLEKREQARVRDDRLERES